MRSLAAGPVQPPPRPLLNLEGKALSPGDCRAIVWMGSGTDVPLALGRHGSEVGMRAGR